MSGKEGKQTQPVSFVEKAGFVPGPSAYGLHMAEFAPECKGCHVAAQQSQPKLTLALAVGHHYHKHSFRLLGTK
ncbi:hypothetical protein [Mesorhizobium erdmanii]|uniref:hypothetical protein n=1 Tax=Mesorhizobium erdmanii TaxID=1777866 RepID=UPI0012DB4584|nr:hypothetical protein [Mesorhizobium erdmanii]